MVTHEEGAQIGRMIGAALDELNAKRPRNQRISQRRAAELAGIHESYWRQVVAGRQTRGDSSYPVKAAPGTYLAMARVVGIEAKVRELLGDEVPDADLHLSDIASPVVAENTPTTDAIRNDPNLMEVAKDHLLRQYELLAQLSHLVTTDGQRAPSPPKRSLRAVARPRPPVKRTHGEGEHE